MFFEFIFQRSIRANLILKAYYQTKVQFEQQKLFLTKDVLN